VSGVEFWFRDAAGEPACLVAAARPIEDANGAWVGARGICRDMTEARAAEAELARARHRERLLAYIVRTIRHEVDPRSMAEVAAGAALPALAASGGRIYRCDAAGAFQPLVEAGEAPGFDLLPALRLLAGSGPSLRSEAGAHLLLAPTQQQGRINGAVCLWRPEARPPFDEDDQYLVGELAQQLGIAIRQIAEQENLRTLSSTDALTGLLNRRGFLEALDRRLAALAVERRSGALLYVDLDNFKPINDRYGHARGDEALAAAARLLGRVTRAGDLVGRLGGDEFVLWLENIDARSATAKAAELVERGRELVRYSAGLERPLCLSVGVALQAADAAPDLEALTARADAAMYEAKRGGKGRFVLAEAPARPE
jgi:diguanylate cyclase (GGDEF)-like protein